jgi:2-polyprenyl-3-methyl-5-hydroxy-6-metoxy-1,4-benzoquinol methylase
MEPGHAIDLGCGEGGDAIWLAIQRWKVTAVDISGVALERAERAAERAGVSVDWLQKDFLERPPAEGAYDLVLTHYPALAKSRADDAIRALLQGVAPGGLAVRGSRRKRPAVRALSRLRARRLPAARRSRRGIG